MNLHSAILRDLTSDVEVYGILSSGEYDIYGVIISEYRSVGITRMNSRTRAANFFISYSPFIFCLLAGAHRTCPFR